MSARRNVQYNSRDDENERAVGDLAAQYWNCELNKLPRAYYIDFLATRDKVGVAWVEVKCRRFNHDEYDTFMVAVQKWNAGWQHVLSTGLPFLIVVGYFDCVKFLEVTDAVDFWIEYGGRTVQQRDDEDIEAMVHIPRHQLKLLIEGRYIE